MNDVGSGLNRGLGLRLGQPLSDYNLRTKCFADCGHQVGIVFARILPSRDSLLCQVPGFTAQVAKARKETLFRLILYSIAGRCGQVEPEQQCCESAPVMHVRGRKNVMAALLLPKIATTYAFGHPGWFSGCRFHGGCSSARAFCGGRKSRVSYHNLLFVGSYYKP